MKKDIEAELESARKKMEGSRLKAEEAMKKVVHVTVKENSKEELRKRRMVMYGLCKYEGKRDEELVSEVVKKIMGTNEVRPTSVERMGNRNGIEHSNRPVIIELRSETEKWKVLGKKSKVEKVCSLW